MAHPRDDETLLAAVPREPDGMAELYARWAPRLGGMMRTAGIPAADIPDVLQGVFVEIWRHAGRFDARRGSAGAWMTQIARHRTIDFLRRHRPADEWQDEGAPLPDPDDRLVVQAGLRALDPRERRLVELAYYSGFSQREIAQLWGVPLGTIKTWSRRALQKMRRAVTDEGADDPQPDSHGPSRTNRRRRPSP